MVKRTVVGGNQIPMLRHTLQKRKKKKRVVNSFKLHLNAFVNSFKLHLNAFLACYTIHFWIFAFSLQKKSKESKESKESNLGLSRGMHPKSRSQIYHSRTTKS